MLITINNNNDNIKNRNLSTTKKLLPRIMTKLYHN